MAPPLDPDDQRPDAFAEPLSGPSIRGVPFNPGSAPQSGNCPSIRRCESLWAESLDNPDLLDQPALEPVPLLRRPMAALGWVAA